MRYRILDIETAAPPSSLTLDATERGVALLVRRGGCPVGFAMRPLAPGTVLGPQELARLSEAAMAPWSMFPPEGSLPTPDTTRPPSLTVAICTRDRPEKLVHCLDSIAALGTSPWAEHVGLRVLVVDNAPSDDRTRRLVAARPRVDYVEAPVRGLNVARNRAVEEITTDFVVFFDDDVRVDAGWLTGFVAACTANPDAAAVTGPVLPAELVTRAQVLFEEYGGFGHRFRRRRFEADCPEDPLYPCSPGLLGVGCNMAFQAAVVRALGGFDDALDTGATLPGGGDLDMLYRLVRNGHPLIVEPRCLVFHQHRREYRELRRQMWTWGLGFMAFVRKSYMADPSQRAKFRRAVARWLRRRFAGIAVATVGWTGRPPGLEAAQLAGGVLGFFGEYERSRRRLEALRARHATLSTSTLGGAT